MLFTHFRLLFCLRMVLRMVQLVFNAHHKYDLQNKLNNTPGSLCACAPNEAFDASMLY